MTYSDDKAMEALKKGDEKAFELIYKKYLSSLRSHAVKIVGCLTIAEDMVQDLFMLLWVKRENVHITLSLNDYLHKSIHNICFNFYKQKKNELEYIEYTLNINDNSGLLQVDNNNDPASILIAHETANIIENAKESLPARCKEVFVLSDDGFTYEEIAEKLGITTGTVGTHINRAKNKLQESLENIEKVKK